MVVGYEENKVMFKDHIQNSEASSLAKLIYEASDPAAPGFRKEVEDFMLENSIREREWNESKNAYKNYIKKLLVEEEEGGNEGTICKRVG